MNDEDDAKASEIYLGFGGRLFHRVPEWVRTDAIFHIRVRCAPGGRPLTQPDTARALLAAARLYHERRRWGARSDAIHRPGLPSGSGRECF